jgi:TolB-like protein/Tfp pilus assembly protein PilF
MKIDNFFAELKRRNVYKVAVAYIVAGWALSQGIAQVFPVFDIPNWVIRAVVLLIILGLPVALVLAWSFELTPEGLKRTETADAMPEAGQRKKRVWIYVVVCGAALSIGLFFLGRYSAINGAPRQSEAATVSNKSIAVLPFDNLSGDPQNAYFSEGVQDEILTRLAKIAELKVISRTSTQRFKSAPNDLRQIAQQLGVANILEGSVQKANDQVRVNVQLINALTDAHLWAETYDRKLTDIFAVESEIARTVAETLRAKLTGTAEHVLTTRPTENPEAHQLYLKGRFYGSKRTAKDAQKSIEYYQQAAAIDPNYALAYAGLAESNWFLAYYSYPQVNEVVPKAQELALKAIELDSGLAEPHSVLGAICFNYDRDFSCTEREQKLAIELNPNYSEGYRRYGLLLYSEGRFEESRIAIGRALEIDPLSPVANFQSAQLLFYERKYGESETLSKKNIELDPNFWYAHWQLFYVYRMKRDYASAVEELAKVQDARGEPDAAKLIRESFAKGDWQGFLRKITEQRSRLKLYPYFVATFFAELGEKDKAFALLNEAIETKDQHTEWLKVDPYMNPLRDDPRFQEVLMKAGFRE